MKNTISMTILVGILTMCLISCTNNNYGQKQSGGAILGGVIGGLLGSQVGKGRGKLAATAAGTLLGVYLGSEIGKSLDEADRVYALRTTAAALENNKVGETSTWSNPDSGHSGSVTPTRTHYRSGAQCRDFKTTCTVDGRTERTIGRACRQADGTWRFVS